MIGRRSRGRHAAGSTRAVRVRAVVIVVATVATVAGGATAWAHWTANGTGQGSAITGLPALLTLAPGSVPRTLYPGGVGDVSVVASNPQPQPVMINSLALDTAQGTGGFTVDSDHQGCAVSALSFTTQTNGGDGWSVPARAGGSDGVLPITLSGAASMSLDAAQACQGADITVYLTAGS